MKKIYVNEDRCLACHLCEYNCAFANSGMTDMVKALKGKTINPRITVEEKDGVCFAVNCRHCPEPLCVKGCITGALTVNDEGMISINRDKCVGCLTCVLSCPFGAIMPSGDGVAQKCQLCTDNIQGEPLCVRGCPNRAIVFEER